MTDTHATTLGRVGRYRLTERLAQGGMAEIFHAVLERAPGIQTSAVVKRLLPALAKDVTYREMFVHEAQLMASLAHRHIVAVLDFGEADGQAYLALEHVEGVDLAQVLAHGRKLSPGVTRYLGLCLAGALDYLHGRRDAKGDALHIVHRDVTPQNIFLGRNGDVKLGDFGIAKTLKTPSRTAAGSTRGKLRYLSPEQARGLVLDGRADLFSLGIVLYEAVVGESPFAAKTQAELLLAVRERRLTAEGALEAAAGPELAAVLRKLLERERALRYGSGAELMEALALLRLPAAGPLDIGALVDGSGLGRTDVAAPATEAESMALGSPLSQLLAELKGDPA